jgi:hypothetical protein
VWAWFQKHTLSVSYEVFCNTVLLFVLKNLSMNFFSLHHIGHLCTTTDNKRGTCVSIEFCPSLWLNVGPDPPAVKFRRELQCNLTSENRVPIVCCTNPLTAPLTSKPDEVLPRPPTQRPNTFSINYGECGKSERSETRIVGGKKSSLGRYATLCFLAQPRETSLCLSTVYRRWLAVDGGVGIP